MKKLLLFLGILISYNSFAQIKVLTTVDSVKLYQKSTSVIQLGQKVDKVSGKQLSTEDYSTAEKAKLGALPANSALNSSLDGKVDKTTTVNGHALSANVTVTKGDVALGNVDNTSDASKPVSTAQAAAIALKQDVLVSNVNIKTVGGVSILGTGDIPVSGSTGVSSVNTRTGAVTLDKTDVGLTNVDNTADASKPVSAAQQSAIDLKAPIASPTFTGTVSGITKSMVGLSNVDNTTDTGKPVSTAQATAIGLKVDKTTTVNSKALSANITLDKTDIGLSNVDNTADTAKPISTLQQAAIDLKASIASPTFTGTVGGITKSMVGLGSVDNTADSAKPVSAAQATAIGLKVDKTTTVAGQALSGNVTLAKGDVGLGNVDNTSDANKPVSTATTTALALKANLASPAFTGTPTVPTQTAKDSTDKAASTKYTDRAIQASLVANAITFSNQFKSDITGIRVDSTKVQKAITLTTTGTNAAAGFTQGTGALNVPNYGTYADGAIVTERSATVTLTNHRYTPRVGTTASSATPTPAGDSNDMFTVTALSANATFAAPTGTPTDGQALLIRIKDNGTARTLAFNSIYRASTDFALPTTTVLSKTMYLQFVYNAADTKWDCTGLTNGF